MENNDILIDLLKQCADAIEWSHRSADGKYHPIFDANFLQKIKQAIATAPYNIEYIPGQRTILYPPVLDWTWMFQRPQQILSQFAIHGWKVIYVNKTQKKCMPPTKVMNNIEVWHDWNEAQKVYKNVDVLWISWAMHHNVNINAKITVYDCLDDFEEWEKYEGDMLKRSDIVFTTSQVLYDKQKSKHKNVVMVRNACDPAFVGSRIYPVPSELIGLKKPIVGFVGALGQWVDAELLRQVANRYSLVIIGPKLGKEPPPNSKYLGVKNYNQLPCYYSNIDVGIIPFIINRVSIAANPIKMYEYMAAGKPVVTTNIPECGLYPEVVLKTDRNNYMDFINNINKAVNIKDCSSTARRLAMENSWGQRFQTIKDEIDKLL